jgi:excisionase family DNA binding protein
MTEEQTLVVQGAAGKPQERLLTVAQVVNLTGASRQTVLNRIFTDQIPGAFETEGGDILIPKSAYEAAVVADVFTPTVPWASGRRKEREARTCANPACGLTFLVIKDAPASESARFCSAECAATGGVELTYQDAGKLIAELRSLPKPLTRERVRQYITQGRLSEPLTRAGVEAAFQAGTLDPKPGIRGPLKAEKGYLTTTEFANRTGLSASTVGDMCADGRLPAKKVRGGYQISNQAYTAFVKKQGAKAKDQA